MKTLLEYIHESICEASGGKKAGVHELSTTPLEFALDVVKDLNIPNFAQNYKEAQNKVKTAKTKRKDMPVIDTSDVKFLQLRLKNGEIDINKPFAKDTNVKNPFPEGLTGKQAETWLKNGLNDGDKFDDIIKTELKDIDLKKLKPIQEQIYVDKTVNKLAEYGVESHYNFVKDKIFIISKDNYIIDGHHRWLTAYLVNPNRKVKCLVIDIEFKKLLPLMTAYSDAIGNQRNA